MVCCARSTRQNEKVFRGCGILFFSIADRHMSYEREPGSATRYVDFDLEFEFLFNTMGRAEKFIRDVMRIPIDNPMLGWLRDRVVIREPVLLSPTLPPTRVFALNYRSNMGSPPTFSLADFAVPSETSSVTGVDWSDDVISRSVESDWYRTTSRPYRLHLKSKALFPGVQNDPDNVLYGSWMFHCLLDGLNRPDQCPGIAIRIISIQPLELPGERRHYAQLAIEFSAVEVLETWKFWLKAGTQYPDGEVATARTFIYIDNPDCFRSCALWKYKDTWKKWQQCNPTAVALHAEPRLF
eukprot:Opistho-2@91729